MGLKTSVRRLFEQPSLDRRLLAHAYLRGEGIEIGALHRPLKVPRGARVRYVDRMGVEELRQHYPELRGLRLVDVDFVEDGETLASFADGSQDFLIANHLIEHSQDPIGTMKNFLRVLRPGGVIYLAVPDMRATFDKDREPTTLDHLIEDHRNGPAASRRGHFEEWVRCVEGIDDDAEAEAEVERLLAEDYSIHYHCWTQAGMLRWMAMMAEEMRLPFEIESFLRHGEECVFVLSRT